jgi:hypothetical protein
MDANERKVAEARISAIKFSEAAVTVRHLFTVLAICFAVWLVWNGITQIAAEQTPDGILAVATLVDAAKMEIGISVTYSVGIGLSLCAWYRERLRNRRLVREKARLQKLLEAQDPNRASSGLTETGGTPPGE